MKKMLTLTMVIMAIVLTLSFSTQAIQNVGPSKFTWLVNDGVSWGQVNGRKTFDYWYSSCLTFTDTPNVVAFSVKYQYTDWGRETNKRASNVNIEIDYINFNLSTNQIWVYAREQLDFNNNRIGFRYLDVDWYTPKVGSVFEAVVGLVRNQGQCTQY